MRVRSVAAFTALALTPLLAPAAANASLKSGVSYQNSFESTPQRSAWTTQNGPGEFAGYTSDHPHSGTVHGRMVSGHVFERFGLRQPIPVPFNARCVARIWGSLTGGGTAHFAVRNSSGQELAGVNFRPTAQPFYQAYDLGEFFPPGDNVFDFSVTLQGAGSTFSIADIDDFAYQCTW